MIKVNHKGDFGKTMRFLNHALKRDYLNILSDYGMKGVEALSAMTPKDTGETASSWNFEITRTSKKTTIAFTNDNIVNGVPIAIILQYGHATGNGGYVEGVDYINPALGPIFQQLADEAWGRVIDVE